MLKRKLMLSVILALGTVGVATIPLPGTAATTVIRLETAPPATRDGIPDNRDAHPNNPNRG